MKKKMIIASICFLPFLIWGMIFVYDVYRFGQKEPLMVIKNATYRFQDGYTHQYCSLGYEFLYTERTHIKGWNFNFGCSMIEADIVNSFQFFYEGTIYENCGINDYLYEDEKRIYSLYCADADSLYVLLDNQKILVKQALLQEKITIDDIANGGYTVSIEQK